jgi:hypothetical protein
LINHRQAEHVIPIVATFPAAKPRVLILDLIAFCVAVDPTLHRQQSLHLFQLPLPQLFTFIKNQRNLTENRIRAELNNVMRSLQRGLAD